jgi:23S rRNA pseudouridine2605 synthase
VLGHLGLTVTRLIRVSFGPFQLGELAAGEIEEVKTRTLREQLGARVAAAAGLDFSGPKMVREVMQAQLSHRHPAVRAERTSKGDGERNRLPHIQAAKRKRRRSDAERIGEPELARREKRHGRRRPRHGRR